jgi:hypothetical protein
LLLITILTLLSLILVCNESFPISKDLPSKMDTKNWGITGIEFAFEASQ